MSSHCQNIIFHRNYGAGLTEGIIGLCNNGQPRKPDDWGASRALDYFETDKAVDAKGIFMATAARAGLYASAQEKHGHHRVPTNGDPAN